MKTINGRTILSEEEFAKLPGKRRTVTQQELDAMQSENPATQAQPASFGEQAMGAVKGAANFFLPRTMDTLSAIPGIVKGLGQAVTGQQINTEIPRSWAEKFAPELANPEILNKTKGNFGASLKQGIGEAATGLANTAPAGAEVASYLAPYGKGWNAVKGFGAMGTIHGLTSPEDLSIEDRLKTGGMEGLLSLLTSGVLKVGGDTLKNVSKKVGNKMAESIVQPNVGEMGGWSKKQAKATQELLNRTKSVTAGGLDTETTEKVFPALSKEIKDKLAANKSKIFISDIEREISEAVTQDLPDFVPDQLTTKTKTPHAIAQIVNMISNRSDGRRKIGSDVLFEVKQALGDKMKKAGIWKRINKGEGLTIGEQAWVVAYGKLKEIIDRNNPGVSKLTEIEHRLFQAGEGVYKWGHPQMQGGIYQLLHGAPALGQLLGGIEDIGMIGARALRGDIPRMLPEQIQKISPKVGGAVKNIIRGKALTAMP